MTREGKVKTNLARNSESGIWANSSLSCGIAGAIVAAAMTVRLPPARRVAFIGVVEDGVVKPDVFVMQVPIRRQKVSYYRFKNLIPFHK